MVQGAATTRRTIKPSEIKLFLVCIHTQTFIFHHCCEQSYTSGTPALNKPAKMPEMHYCCFLLSFIQCFILLCYVNVIIVRVCANAFQSEKGSRHLLMTGSKAVFFFFQKTWIWETFWWSRLCASSFTVIFCFSENGWSENPTIHYMKGCEINMTD